MERDSETTPIDRPLLRSDINDVRVIVQQISERQLEFLTIVGSHGKRLDASERRLDAVERRLWFPVLVGVVAAAMAVLARVVP